MKPDKWELFKDSKGKWRWRRTASNGRIVGASSEGYTKRSDCLRNARKNGYSNDRWEIYQDQKSEWRWRCTAPNGKIVGASTEGYRNRPDCVENALRYGYYEPRPRSRRTKRRLPSRGERLDLYAAARFLPLKIEKDVGLRIPFDVYLQDPSLEKDDPGCGFAEEFYVPWEPYLADGPTSSRFAVVDYNGDTGALTPPARWQESRQAFVYSGEALDRRCARTPQFHQVNVWALLQEALRYYEEGFGLGRAIPWAFEGSRLLVVPHAGYGQNAFYDRDSRSLQFYYFDSDDKRVETCLSADIVRHEFGHAVLDGIRPYYIETSSVETAAFHEFLGDLTAILLLLRNNNFRRRLADRVGGNLSLADQVANIAEQFGQAVEGTEYLRSARSEAKMADMADERRPHKLSQVLVGAMFEILRDLSDGYLENGVRSAKSAFWYAIQRMQRTALQPLDLLPPVEVMGRDYAKAVLRAEELANPRDPRGYGKRMARVFRKRGILSAAEAKEFTAPGYLHDRMHFDVFPDVEAFSQSRPAAYQFIDANRRCLFIPWNRDVVIADLYSAQKLGRQARRLPRQVVLEYVWREEVAIEGRKYGFLDGETTTMLCGGTLVFDERGNVLSWFDKRGTEYDRGAAGAEAAAEGKKRRAALLTGLEDSAKVGEVVNLRGDEGAQRASTPLVRAALTDGTVRFRLSPHLSLRDESEATGRGGRRWQMSF